MLIGRTKELANLRDAFLHRRSLLVCGPAGSGKSALLAQVLSSLPSTIRRSCILCNEIASPLSIFQSLVRSLAKARAPEVLSRMEREAGSAQEQEHWLAAQTSLRLRGVLRKVMRAREYRILLEANAPIPGGVYRLLQEWVWSGRTPVIVLGRGATERELGKVARLYWHSGLRLTLGPLEPSAAGELLELTIVQWGLERFADDEFRQFVLSQSERFPGRIMHLCQMAAQESYHYEGRIKLHTLAVDFLLLEQDGGAPPVQRVAHHG